jgi:hypothetical protein
MNQNPRTAKPNPAARSSMFSFANFAIPSRPLRLKASALRISTELIDKQM